MTSVADQKRIIALDVRPQSFGYVVMEGPVLLLDWGARSFRGGLNAVRAPAPKKLAELLREFEPDAVILHEPVRQTRMASAKQRTMLDVIKQEAKRRCTAVHSVSREAIQVALGGQNRLTKHEIASRISNRFGALGWKLPPKRRCWESEDYRMSIFDAAALGVAYFSLPANSLLPPAPSDTP